ncbi:hypothetical protein C8R45DRAFT_938571 [Mycena sanguinolenta]|nr:hypothetical protein C8R45DRAFT_938571 [Mycena sanguinolenta]
MSSALPLCFLEHHLLSFCGSKIARCSGKLKAKALLLPLFKAQGSTYMLYGARWRSEPDTSGFKPQPFVQHRRQCEKQPISLAELASGFWHFVVQYETVVCNQSFGAWGGFLRREGFDSSSTERGRAFIFAEDMRQFSGYAYKKVS